MDLGAALSAAQTLFAALQCSQLDDVCSILGYKSQLDNLKKTVDTVKAVLDDAESIQDQVALLSKARLYVVQLKDVLYDAEDLLDEFATLSEQKKLINKDGSVTKKVRSLVSRFKSLGVAPKMSQGVKEIRKRLDAIAKDHNSFGFKLDCQPTRQRSRDTCSYVYTKDIIGREDDVENIVSKVLDPNVQQDVSCLAIVGMGGLGKTTLAQLVYNDPRIEKRFPLRSWTCVSDQDQKHCDVRVILSKILLSITERNHKDFELENLQKQLREQLVGKKFFLVLDDVWNEHRLQWVELEKFLQSGMKGSWILVTTRSEKTTTAIGDKQPYKLKGLSNEDSWHLFEITAFGRRDEHAYSSDLIEIGQGIVKRCANVPLAIKAVGSLLYGQGKDKWTSFQKTRLLKSGGEGGIEPILKLSYHHLDSPLKTCFRYCAIFPKDHVIEKEMLINLWMAQDYIFPLEENQSVEDAGEEYFSILVKRCFFQDVEEDEYGNIVSCKIHDLMHDIALEVAGNEVRATYDPTNETSDNNVRHLYAVSADVGIERSFSKTKIRTCLCISRLQIQRQPRALDMLLRNLTCLRTLSLRRLRIKDLPSALGKLLHLRYLDLSCNVKLEMLPKSITKLLNLQNLDLRGCHLLKELPRDLPNLLKLRVLYIDGGYSSKLNGMPRDMGKMSCLVKLPRFVVGDRNCTLKRNVVDQMEDLKALVNLKGRFLIRILKNCEYSKGDGREGGYMSNKEHLISVSIEFPYRDNMVEYEEELLLDDLQPHGNLKELKLRNYQGRRMPSWAMEDHLETFLPNLVEIRLVGCGRLQHLASLRKLHHLKLLSVWFMDKLEYIESRRSNGIMNDASGSDTFFPSLKKLDLYGLPKLKEWWRDDGANDGQEHSPLPPFSSLSKLCIQNCPNLTSFPTCPTVEELELGEKLNKKMRIMNGNVTQSANFKLRKLVTKGNAKNLKWALPIEAFQCLQEMTISLDSEMESLSQVEEVFRSCSLSLRCLEINACRKLTSVCGGLEHLTALEDLKLYNLRNLNLSSGGEREGEGEEEDGMPWRSLHHSLRSLKLEELPKMVSLPNGMKYLTALQSLEIVRCRGLESLPESIRQLTSLQTFQIAVCSKAYGNDVKNTTGKIGLKFNTSHVVIYGRPVKFQ